MSMTRVYYNINTYDIIFIEKNDNTDSNYMLIDENILDRYNMTLDCLDFLDVDTSLLYNSKAYNIDKYTKKLNIIYYTEEEIKARENSLLEQQKQAQSLQDRVSTISDYLANDNIDLISKVENLIIESELDKLLN